MKTKLIPREDIVLRTQGDCYKALLDGFILCYNKNFYWKLVEGTLSLSEDGLKNYTPNFCNFVTTLDFKVFEEKQIEWYEDIPEGGVLCWVRDNEKVEPYIDIIHRWSEEEEKFRGIGSCPWKFATPLTKQEIQALLDNAPGE